MSVWTWEEKKGIVMLKDDQGWYVARRKDGRVVQRTLSTKDETRADAWLRRTLCHGFTHHTEDCTDCKEAE